MKIWIRDKERTYRFWIPGCLIWGRVTLCLVGIGLRAGKRYLPEETQGLAPELVEKLLLELRRIKKIHGNWDLAEVQSSDGTFVKVIL